MKEFTAEMLEQLKKANASVMGTGEYNKFSMLVDFLNGKRWKFAMWGIPHMVGTIKTFKGNTYIVTTDAYGDSKRYTVTDEVRALLGL